PEHARSDRPPARTTLGLRPAPPGCRLRRGPAPAVRHRLRLRGEPVHATARTRAGLLRADRGLLPRSACRPLSGARRPRERADRLGRRPRRPLRIRPRRHRPGTRRNRSPVTNQPTVPATISELVDEAAACLVVAGVCAEEALARARKLVGAVGRKRFALLVAGARATLLGQLGEPRRAGRQLLGTAAYAGLE